ncbi:hypothetical protein KQX64_07085 [Rhodopseudomonas palustris]|nr:hypothetical protein KQX64_07085 [Rhodopseudomonas palustris]
MSLINLAVRLSAVKALKGATLAGSRVFDSQIDALDDRITKDKAPAIVVYIDEDEGSPVGCDLVNADRSLSLVIEISVASKIIVGDVTEVVIPYTDPGLEASLNIIGWQVMRSLQASDSEWAKLWRLFVTQILGFSSYRGASAEKGVRWAARQIVLKCETLSEPAYGLAPAAGEAWGQFLAALSADADPGLASLSGLLRQVIAEPELPDWRSAAAVLGVNADIAAGIGIAPADPTMPEAAPPATEIIAEPDDGTPPVVVTVLEPDDER